MSIIWSDLRPLNGSQQTAFEELCCQLAASETVPGGAVFIRKGAPDAGVECYWKLPDGSEWGWQAKFFISPPDNKQWDQIDDSVAKAIEKHPRLRRYVVCLPIDRQDPRVDGQKWFMDKWNEHVKAWEGLATEREMVVAFEYWGAHELFIRLSREEHRGRYYFWFHRDLFGLEWFQTRIEEAVANVGPRYSPELDVQLPVSWLFHGLGRTPDFFTRVKGLRKKIKEALPHGENKNLLEKSQQLNNVVERLWKLLNLREKDTIERFDWDGVGEAAHTAMEISSDCAQTLSSMVESLEKEPNEKKSRDEIESLKSFASNYRRLYQKLQDLHEYAASDEARLSNLPALLLVAGAGLGKTHLFCDVAQHRISNGMPTVLLVGGQFNVNEPWSQITGLLGLSCTREEFLGALEAAAQAHKARALILIDALNEGQGKTLWKKHLAGILLAVSRSPWLGIAINVRTSYEDIIIPDGLVPSRLIRAEHYGFTDHEYEAAKTFFAYYGIQMPGIPLLVPEFQNPLFLKIFCQGLKNSGLSSIPPGLQGITAIFKFFIDSVNKRLSEPEYLDFNSKLEMVWRAIEGLAAQLAEQGKDWLPIVEAQEIINRVLPRDGYENSMFRHLLSEGVVAENRFYIGNNQWSEGIHFAYERFTDHLVAKYLLDAHLDENDPASSFVPGKPLAKYVQDARSCAMYRGLIEAFAVQLPERAGKELVEIVPSIRGFHAVVEAFIDSIIWRRPQSVSIDAAVEYINAYVIHDSNLHARLLNALLTVAVNPDHPLNADFLHRNLLRFELAERDAWWTTFLHREYGAHGAVDRLVDWAWSPDDKSHIEDRSIRLCGMALAWFLTASNRFLRDRATKALVRLFADRIIVLRTVIQSFTGVNDPYVYERLMAVAYGCAMRSEDDEAIGGLANDIYNWVFRDGRPPVHILLRDYARGVIEVALHRKIDLEIDLSRVRPPYGSTFPENIPTEEELKAKYDNFKSARRDIDYAQSKIWHSVMSWGDFARYIIGTNSGSFNWSSQRLGEPVKPTRKELYEAFVATLTKKQKEVVEKYRQIRDNIAFCRRLDQAGRKKFFKVEFTDEQLDEALQEADELLQKRLGKKKYAQLSGEIMRYIDNLHEDEFRFDLSLAQRWILQRVFELGWTVERFGYFDRNINYMDMRSAHKPERIGKKYQWIAYHEFLARVADNFEFRGDRREPKDEKYDGPWQDMFIRDIDPSWVLPKTQETSGWSGFEPTWWVPVEVVWDNGLTDKEWIREIGDLPAVYPLIEVVNPQNNSRWLTLEGFYRWENKHGIEDDSRYPHRDIVYSVRSYIVKQSDADELYEWMKTQWRADSFELPESRPLYRVFLGEYFWAPAFLYHNVPYYHHAGWIGGKDEDKIPKPVLVTTDQYSLEDSGFDCSIDESVRVYLPCKWIADRMGLRWKGREGHFYNATGNLIAFDPSVNFTGPGALLINHDLFLEYLNENGYDLLWVLAGEKLVITGDIPGDDWSGRLEILGVFHIKNGQVCGELNTRFSK